MKLTLSPGQFPQNPQQATLYQQALLAKRQVQDLAKTMAKLDNTSADSVQAKDAVSISDYSTTGQKIRNVLALGCSSEKLTGVASFEAETKELKSLDVDREPLWGGTDHRSVFQKQDDDSKVYYASNIGHGILVHEDKDGRLVLEDQVWNYEGQDTISGVLAENQQAARLKDFSGANLPTIDLASPSFEGIISSPVGTYANYSGTSMAFGHGHMPADRASLLSRIR